LNKLSTRKALKGRYPNNRARPVLNAICLPALEGRNSRSFSAAQKYTGERSVATAAAQGALKLVTQ